MVRFNTKYIELHGTSTSNHPEICGYPNRKAIGLSGRDGSSVGERAPDTPRFEIGGLLLKLPVVNEFGALSSRSIIVKERDVLGFLEFVVDSVAIAILEERILPFAMIAVFTSPRVL